MAGNSTFDIEVPKSMNVRTYKELMGIAHEEYQKLTELLPKGIHYIIKTKIEKSGGVSYEIYATALTLRKEVREFSTTVVDGSAIPYLYNGGSADDMDIVLRCGMLEARARSDFPEPIKAGFGPSIKSLKNIGNGNSTKPLEKRVGA